MAKTNPKTYGLLCALCLLAACRGDYNVYRIYGSTIHFVPDEVRGNVTEWWYQFDSYTDLIGCNHSNGDSVYRGTGWEYTQAGGTVVTVHFGSDWERYEMHAYDIDEEEGWFDYSNSNGPSQDMSGTWTREDGRYCSNL